MRVMKLELALGLGSCGLQQQCQVDDGQHEDIRGLPWARPRGAAVTVVAQ